MAKFALLNNVDHQDLRVITERSASYGDKVMQSVTFPFEFRNIQAHYPILFHQHGEAELQPVALLGFQDGENLFLDDSGWKAGYVPAMIRRVPFLIGYQDSNEADGERQRLLTIDVEHPRVNKEFGETLFQPLGGRTPFLENMANLLEHVYDGMLHSNDFVKALMQHDLIESVTFEITLNDGSKNQLLGFHALNEDKIPELSGKTLEDFSRRGFLMPLFMVLASMANVQKLVELKNKAMELS